MFTYFFSIYSSFLTIIFSLYFSTSFVEVFHKRGVHMLHICNCLLFSIAEQFVTKTLPEFSVLFIYKFLHPFFNANVWLYVTHTGLFFIGAPIAVIFKTSSESSMSDLTLSVLSCCCSSTFNLCSILTSIAFQELSYILWTLKFHFFFFFSLFPFVPYPSL